MVHGANVHQHVKAILLLQRSQQGLQLFAAYVQRDFALVLRELQQAALQALRHGG